MMKKSPVVVLITGTLVFLAALIGGIIVTQRRSLDALHRKQLNMTFKLSPYESCPYISTLARIINLRAIDVSPTKRGLFEQNGVVTIPHSTSLQINHETELSAAVISNTLPLGIGANLYLFKDVNETQLLEQFKVIPEDHFIYLDFLANPVEISGADGMNWLNPWLFTQSPKFLLQCRPFVSVTDKDTERTRRFDLLAIIEPVKRDTPVTEYILYLKINHRWYLIEDHLNDAHSETPYITSKVTLIENFPSFPMKPIAAIYRDASHQY